MLWVGLTGSLGSGKSTVSDHLRKMGFAVADADDLAHKSLQVGTPAYHEVIQAFGPEIVKLDQSIDRGKLAQVVFNDSARLSKLEAIIHPIVKLKVQEAKTLWEQENREIAFYDVPLLFEKNMQHEFHLVVVVSITAALQKERLMARDNWSEADIKLRMQKQQSIEGKVARAQFVIKNNGSKQDLEIEIEKMLGFLKSRISKG